MPPVHTVFPTQPLPPSDHFVLHGDFDIEASVDQLQLDSDKYACVMLVAHIDDAKQQMCRIIRQNGRTNELRQFLHTSLSVVHPDGSRTFGANQQAACEAPRGRLRLARRGDVIHYLFAEHDSDVFRVIGTEVVSDKPTQADGLRLRALCDGIGAAQVVWKDVTLRAERITYLPADRQPQRGLYFMNLDGTDPQRITVPVKNFTHLGSTEWSADGKQLVCDMSMGGTDTSHVMIMNADGSDIRDLTTGCMPSLSPDGKQIVFSRAGAGIMKINSDGTKLEQIERSGWGTQWSPDGRYIAWGQGNNITLLNTRTDERHSLLTDEQASQLRYIYWNLGWSHDGRSLAFKARDAATDSDLVVVADVDSPDGFKVLYSGKGINADFTWHPNGKTVLFSAKDSSANAPRLFTIDRDTDQPPELLPGQPDDWKIFDCDWSPDGQRIVFCATAPPQPIEWPVVTNSGD